MTEETLKRKLDSDAVAETKRAKVESESTTEKSDEKVDTSVTTEGETNDKKEEISTENGKSDENSVEKDAKKTQPEGSEAKGNDDTDDDRNGKEESAETSEKEALTDNDATSKDTTPAFGSKGSFANAFKKSTAKPDVFASSEERSTTGVFGSNLLFGSKSKFGNAFQQALRKPSFLDSPEPQANAEDSVDDSRPKLSQQYKQVDLEEKEITTGEENEESVYSAKVKVFELDLANIKEGWKERGVGPLHLNKSKLDPKEVRIVMRSQGLLRVVLNYKITPETELLKGLEASLSPGKFLRLNSVNDGKVVQYLLKFANEATREELVSKIKGLQEDMTK
uniref:RanBD1 domain-containing protein n=1 Tax=Candidozyma auris TaxID=498019 RepID=A0A0L0NVM3_CANAR